MNTQHEDDNALEQDDAVIGRALRMSMWVVITVFVLGSLGWVIISRDKPVVEVSDAEIGGALSVATNNEPPTVRFSDIAQSAGVTFTHDNGAYGERLLPETMGSGVAFFDYDNDGDQDLLFANSTSWPGQPESGSTPALFRNRGDGTFDEVTAELGLDFKIYGMGIAIADFDGDGWRDIYLTAVGENRLLRNMGGSGFEDISAQAGVAGSVEDWSTSALFFDYDRDGDMDLFVANYVQWSPEIDFEVDYRLTGVGRAYGPPTNYGGTHSVLYHNEGDGVFTDVSRAAGIEVSNPATGQPMGKALALGLCDYDDDGWLDVIVANDTVQNFLFRNNQNGTFTESGAISGIAYDNSGSSTGAMGVDVAWYQNNDDLAVAIGNFANEMTSFYVDQGGDGLFTDEAIVSGVGPASRRALSFGVFFFDYDLDGRLDMLQTNGHVESEINIVQPSQQYKQATQLFWNCGDSCSRSFVPVESAGDLHRPVVGRGAAYADIDGDGDIDIVITQTASSPLLLRNELQTEKPWIRVQLKDVGKNTDAIGAVVELIAEDSRHQRQRVAPGRSYLSQVELPLTFALGDRQTAAIRITWPDGGVTETKPLQAGKSYVITRAVAKPAEAI